MHQNFFKDFDIYTKNEEAHRNYLKWSAISVLSSLASRKFWLKIGNNHIFSPDLYIVLVGEAGNRKTTAMEIGRKIVSRINKFLSDDKKIIEAGDNITSQRLIEKISENPRQYKDKFTYHPITIYAGELASFMDSSGESMITLLTDMYGKQSHKHDTVSGIKVEIEKPYINLIACTQPEHIENTMKYEIIRSGFTRRCIFVYENSYTRKAFTRFEPEIEAAFEKLVEWGLKLVQAEGGELSITEEAREAYEKWYMSQEKCNDNKLSGYYNSKHVQVLKLSMLSSLSESLDMKIQAHHIAWALQELKIIESKLIPLFYNVGNNLVSNTINKTILTIDRKYNRVCSKGLLIKEMANHVTRYSEIPECLRLMIHTFGYIEDIGDGKNYRLTEKAINEIVCEAS